MSLDPVKTNLFKGQIGQTHTPLNVAVQSSNPSILQSSSTSKVGEFCSGFLAPFKAIARGIAWIFRTLFCWCASAKLKEQELKDMIKLVFTFYYPSISRSSTEVDFTALNALAKNIALNPNIESYVIENFANKNDKKILKEAFEGVKKNGLGSDLRSQKQRASGFVECILEALKNNFNRIEQSQNTTLATALQGMLLLCTEFALNCRNSGTKEAFRIYGKLQSNPEAKKELMKFVNEYGGKKLSLDFQDHLQFEQYINGSAIKEMDLELSIKDACAGYLKHLFVPENS